MQWQAARILFRQTNVRMCGVGWFGAVIPPISSVKTLSASIIVTSTTATTLAISDSSSNMAPIHGCSSRNNTAPSLLKLRNNLQRDQLHNNYWSDAGARFDVFKGARQTPCPTSFCHAITPSILSASSPIRVPQTASLVPILSLLPFLRIPIAKRRVDGSFRAKMLNFFHSTYREIMIVGKNYYDQGAIDTILIFGLLSLLILSCGLQLALVAV